MQCWLTVHSRDTAWWRLGARRPCFIQLMSFNRSMLIRTPRGRKHSSRITIPMYFAPSASATFTAGRTGSSSAGRKRALIRQEHCSRLQRVKWPNKSVRRMLMFHKFFPPSSFCGSIWISRNMDSYHRFTVHCRLFVLVSSFMHIFVLD